MARARIKGSGRATSLLVALAACGAVACGNSQQASGGAEDGAGAESSRNAKVALQRIGSFSSPVDIVAAPGFPRLLFVVEQGGRIIALDRGRPAGTFLDLSGRVSTGGERGLLSLAFPPDYRRSGRLYVYYTDREGDIRVDEFRRRGPTRARLDSQRAVIEIPHREHSNHNGGQLRFLGDLLYFGTGDGGGGGDPSNNAQNPNSLLGKLLRIDPRPGDGRPYRIPASNPFVGRGGGRGEIYSLGLRNPFRFSFDTVTRPGRPRIAIGDVGQSRFEELDYLTVGAARGANFGWDAFEGFSPYEDEASGTPDPGGTVKPIFAYPHSRNGSCTIIGGQVVADRRLRGLHKRYIYADLCEGQLRSLVPGLRRARGDRGLGLRVETPTTFGEDLQGRVYVASLEGPVYRLVPR